jgi:hypothetical protein
MSVQHRLAAFERSRVANLRRVIYISVFLLLSYGIYWKWFLPFHMRPLYALMYGCVFILLPAVYVSPIPPSLSVYLFIHIASPTDSLISQSYIVQYVVDCARGECVLSIAYP